MLNVALAGLVSDDEHKQRVKTMAGRAPAGLSLPGEGSLKTPVAKQHASALQRLELFPIEVVGLLVTAAKEQHAGGDRLAPLRAGSVDGVSLPGRRTSKPPQLFRLRFLCLTSAMDLPPPPPPLGRHVKSAADHLRELLTAFLQEGPERRHPRPGPHKDEGRCHRLRHPQGTALQPHRDGCLPVGQPTRRISSYSGWWQERASGRKHITRPRRALQCSALHTRWH